MPLLEELESVDWSALAQPEWNQFDSVPSSLVAIARAESPVDETEAYNRFLYAIGNNEAGTYYPVALQTLPFLHQILEFGSPSARRTTLNVLVDLLASFYPDPAVPAATRDLLDAEFRASVATHWQAVREFLLSMPDRSDQELVVLVDQLLLCVERKEGS